MPARLDALDWKILEELQNDGRMTNVELAHRIGISPPPCLRRVERLKGMTGAAAKQYCAVPSSRACGPGREHWVASLA